MSRSRLGALLLVVLATALVCGWVGARQRAASSGSTMGNWIVVLKDGVNGQRVMTQHADGVNVRRVYGHAVRGFAGRMTSRAVKRLRRDRRVLCVEQDGRVYMHAQTLPPGIDRVQADENTFAKIDGLDERVDADIAIIDSGIDLDHEDLNVVYDEAFRLGLPDGDDQFSHGTHCAGIAAALDNDIGVVGVAPGARLWALRVFDATGYGEWSDVLAALDFVAANADTIDVVNMSIGGYGPRDSMLLAVQQCVNQGVVVVTSAGNEYRDVYGWDGVYGTWDDLIPASFPEVVAVSAMCDTDGVAGGVGAPYVWQPPYPPYVSADDVFAFFTNFSRSVVTGNPVTSLGAAIDLAAPGVGVYSTLPDDKYGTKSGTSMSSPHVAGAAALYIAEHGRATDAAGVYAIRQALIDLGDPQALWGPSTHDPDGNHEYLLNVSSLPRPPPPPGLLVDVWTNKQRYRTWDRATITAEVMSEGDPVEGAAVYVEITTPKGLKYGYAATEPRYGYRKELRGIYVVRFKVRAKRNGYGTYRVRAMATKSGYAAGEAMTVFTARR